MSKKLLTVILEELIVNSNGDLPGSKPSDDPDSGKKNNSLCASLVYPRSGAPQVTSTKQYDLPNGKPATLLDHEHPDPFFDPLLFREEVLDRTVLSIKITDRDASSGLEKFFLALFGTVLGAGFSAVTGGLPAILGAVTGFGIDHVKSRIGDAGDEVVTTIGRTTPLPLVMDELSESPRRVDLPLIAPSDVIKTGLTIDPVTNQAVSKEFVLLKKGANNGRVILQISAVPA